MVEEVLKDFLDWLFARYQEILDRETTPLGRLTGLFMTSFEAIEHRHAQVVIYQDEAKRLSSIPQFDFVDERNREQRKMWVDILQQGISTARSVGPRRRPGLPRSIRDTTWVSVRWYQPGGPRRPKRSAGNTSPSSSAESPPPVRSKETADGFNSPGVCRRCGAYAGR